MKGFIEVKSVIFRDIKGKDCGFIDVLINVADISTVEERHYILDEEDGVAITMKNNREFCALETIKEIEKKIYKATEATLMIDKDGNSKEIL